MTPAARVQTTIELLDQMLEGNAPEKVLTGWARKSRFAGSKDRAAIRSFFFDALRCKRSYAAYGGALTGRGLMLGLLKDQQIDPQTLFTGQGYGPSELSPDEFGPAATSGLAGRSMAAALINISASSNDAPWTTTCPQRTVRCPRGLPPS